VKVPNQKTETRVGDCPNCNTSLYATLEVALSVTMPSVASPGNLQASVKPTIVGMTIGHSCGTRPAALPQDAGLEVATSKS
jgi:hypothetical protein